LTYEPPKGLAKRVFDTLCAAPEAQTLQDLNEIFKPTLNAMGFAYFSLVEASTVPKNLSLKVLFGQPDTAWVEAYTRERLAAVDPRMRHMLGSSEPAFLSEMAPRHDIADDQHFLEKFASYGHTDCYVWPVHLPEGGVRAVLMLSDLPEVGAEARAAVGALASGFHIAGAKLLRRLKAVDRGGVVLRPRQLECLYWARQGKSSADIGHILGISSRTVDEHIGNAAEALGVRTRIQAVARAVMLGLF
jgi:DNA-binding CsgD family transcriptional regulator